MPVTPNNIHVAVNTICDKQSFDALMHDMYCQSEKDQDLMPLYYIHDHLKWYMNSVNVTKNYKDYQHAKNQTVIQNYFYANHPLVYTRANMDLLSHYQSITSGTI